MIPSHVTAMGVAVTTGAAAFVLVAVLTEATRAFALRHGIVDRPAATRPHRRPTPYLGGVALVAGTLLPPVVAIGGWTLQVAMIMAGGVLVAVIGAADDLRPLHPAVRLLTEGAVAAAVVAAGVRLHLLEAVVPFGGWLDAVLTTAWIVFVTNVFNMIDNTDGVLGSITITTAGTLAAAAYLTGRPDVALLAFSLAVGCLGFVAHNWAPARIFMGDAGSLYIGFTLAACAVTAFQGAAPATALPALLLITFVPTVDTCLAVVARRRARRSWLVASPDHLAHRLVAAGFAPRQIALVLSAAATVTSLLALHLTLGRIPGPLALAGVLGAGAGLVALLLRAPGRYPSPPPRPPTRDDREPRPATVPLEERH
ncbi:MraY family glycosyltransferase [Sphaerisporangium sp. TRM90804]|uniref:glycosyltransferase family 4 protein n=1 Tax=Sphaerisporangium sp. TRM90804 TaxID=3031113 RepID=UPI0024481CBA|nr:MraY family glycosyltransferase [Sphaerisporangium sp. TRM90804]MDH2424140.1 MraY family glycosyltransferase [Sphaerisporangium sp. TRM90804]